MVDLDPCHIHGVIPAFAGMTPCCVRNLVAR
jgi:hypothetical protein